MSDTLGIALVGCGTVGGGVAEVLLRHQDRLARRAGRPLALRRVVVRDPNKPRDPAIPRELLTTDLAAAIHDPAVHVVVELIGGTTTAKKVVLDALAAGKHVVTANKALLAEPGTEIFEAARKAERAVASRPRRRRRADHPGPGREPRGQSDHRDPGHPQRHVQLHPHRDDRARA